MGYLNFFFVNFQAGDPLSKDDLLPSEKEQENDEGGSMCNTIVSIECMGPELFSADRDDLRVSTVLYCTKFITT